MVVGAGLCMYDVVVKTISSSDELLVISVDSEDLNGELDDVSQHSKNGVISNEFQQALSSHFDSSSHRDSNKDIGKFHII